MARLGSSAQAPPTIELLEETGLACERGLDTLVRVVIGVS